jgi:subtilisin-like proprotein convertase family protein
MYFRLKLNTGDKMKRLITAIFLLALLNPVYAQYISNHAAKFSGSNSYITYANQTFLNPSSAITLEAWVNPSVIGSSFMGVMGKGGSYSIGIQGTTGRISFIPKNGSFFQSKFSSRVPINQWTHIAGTYDGSTTIIYINGIIDTATFSIGGTIPSSTDSLFIGATATNFFYYNGLIDNARIWSTARNISQIKGNMFIPLEILYPTGAFSGMVASFQLDNGASSFSGNNTMSGNLYNVSFVNYSNKPVNYQDYNSSLVLNGSTDYFKYANQVEMNATTEMTLEAWIRRDTTGAQPPGDQYIICKNGASNRTNYKLWIDVTGSLKFKINDPGGPPGLQTPPTALITNGQWTHVAATYNSTTGSARLYVNGNQASSSTISGNPQINNNPDSLFIGGVSPSNSSGLRFKGQMDDIRIWRVERTPDEIKENTFKRLRGQSTGFSFENYTNWMQIPSGFVGAVNQFVGSAHISSSLSYNSNERTSPILPYDFFLTPNYVNSYKKFFIPDNNAAGVSDSIFISGSGTVSMSKVFVLLSHTNVSNMTVMLTSPSGTSRILIGNKGGNGHDIMTIFSDAADSLPSLSTAINGAGVIAPFSPGIKPEQPLSGLDGQSRQGWWKLKFIDNGAGNIGYVHGWGIQTNPLVGIDPLNQTADRYELSQNYPNPFNPSTKINFSLPKAGMVKLTIYNILGKEMKTLVNERKDAGSYAVDFNGEGLPSGVYFYRITAGEFSEIKKMMLVK